MTTAIIFILILGLLVFVHEFGHFIVAKKNGIAVEEFSIGFPPRLFTWKRKETLYSINVIPLGGYVKLKGEGGELTDDKDSFAHKKIWQRASVLSAGVAMNFITAGILLSIGFLIGFPLSTNEANISKYAKISDAKIQIVQILPDSPAEQNDIRMGDIINKINNQEFTSVSQVQTYINNLPEASLTLTLQRGDKRLIKEVSPYELPDIGKKGIGIALTKTALVKYPIWLAPYEGFKKMITVTIAMLIAFGALIHNIILGNTAGMQVSGPVGIAILTGQIAELGIIYLLQFTAILSINLAIINLLPFPALDGSHLFLLIIEKIRGKRLAPRIEQFVHLTGFAVLLLLMVWITYKDVLRFIIN